jgi:hypothetical protein
LTGQRKPLLQVRNEVFGSAVLANGSGDADEGYQGEEKYFNVLW